MGCLLCIICNTNSFHSFYTSLAYIQISSKLLGMCVGGVCVCVCVWGGSINLHSLPLLICQYTISILPTQVQSRVWSCFVLFCAENVFYFVHPMYTYHNCEGIHAKLGHVKGITKIYYLLKMSNKLSIT